MFFPAAVKTSGHADSTFLSIPAQDSAQGTSLQKIECASTVDQRHWDELAERLGGCFSHCFAYGVHESFRSNVDPLFVRAFDQNGVCIGIAVGRIESPRIWPFSRFCKNAVLGALPATRDQSTDIRRMIMVAVEKHLKRMGVFTIHVCSYDSPDSASVLSMLSYRLDERHEFYIDLTEPLEGIWKKLRGTRRTDIRKAEKLGVTTAADNTMVGVRLFERFQTDSMQRRHMQLGVRDGEADRATTMLLDSGRAMLLVSYLDGTPVNAAMFGILGGKAYYLYSGSSLAGNKCCGPVHLIWTAIRLLKANGCQSLNLGGVTCVSGESSSDNGLYSFKRDFGAAIFEQPAGTKTISRWGFRLNALLSFLKPIAVY